MTTTDPRPKSIESEQALIGAVLRGGRETFERVRFISSSMFFSTSNQNVWSGIERIYENGMSIDVIVIGDEMERMLKMGELEQEWGDGIRNGRALLVDLRSTGDPRNVETYAEQVQDYHIKRHLLDYSSKIASWSMNGRRGKDIIADVSAEFSKISVYNAQEEYTVPIGVASSEGYDWTGKAASGEIVGVPTGFKDLDGILGQMIAGNVYLVAARPKQGKTALLLSILYHAAKTQKKRVGIFSLEMSRMQVAQRLHSFESGIDVHRIMQGKLEDREWAPYTHAVETVSSLPIVINDLSSLNIQQIRQTARKMKAGGGLDLLILDYIQLANGSKKAERRDLEVSEVSRELKYLARELNVPILAAAQLSRAVEQRSDKRPILSDLRESGSLENDAYAVMFIYRPDQYGDTTQPNMAQIIVAAHRNGPVGDCQLMFRGSLTKFENAAYRQQRDDYTDR